MTLYRENPPGAFAPWRGERIGEGDEAVSYPLHIEQLWPANELEAIGLWRDDMIAPADEVPEGKRSTGREPQRVNGVVKFVHTLEDASVPTIDDVKAEAHRRIIYLCPEWKQRNLTAQAVILAKQVADGEVLTTEQQAAWDAGQALWAQIAAIRAKSDAIEAMSPIPHDFTDDTYWNS